MAGRTTMERHGRGPNDNDRENRIRNSGIQNDMQVYRSNSRVATIAGQPIASSFSMLNEDDETEEQLERLIGAADNTQNTSMASGRVPKDQQVSPTDVKRKRAELRKRDKQLTEISNRRNSCWAFLRQRQIKPQSQIFRENLIVQGKTEAVPLPCSQ